MHSWQTGDTREMLPGISAVLAVTARQADLESVVLDLGAVLDGLVADNFEVVVVQFGRDAPNRHLLADMTARCPKLPVRVLDKHFADRQSALRAGFDAGSYDLLFVTTADGQFDTSELNHLLEAIEHGADLAIGYRPLRADGVVKRFGSWVGRTALRLRAGKVARDVNCEFKLFRRVVWDRARPRPATRQFYADLLVGAHRLGFVIEEVAVNHHRARRTARAPAWAGDISFGHRAA